MKLTSHFLNKVFIVLILFYTTGCLSEGGGTFGDLLSSEPDTDGVIEIVDQTPTVVPTVTATTGDTTFAVSIASGAGNNVKYKWELDGNKLADSSRAFYTLSASALTSGSHSLKVTAYNSISSDVYTYIIDKNTPPTLSSPTPSATGSSVTCGSGTLSLSVHANDPEGANLTYVWKINGVAGSSFFTNHVYTNTGSSIDFTPNCTLTGLATISVEVRDGYDTTVISPLWNVTIVNSGVASIDGLTPNSSPYVIIPSTSFKTFTMVNPTGVPPVTYSWELNGTPIPGELSTSMDLYATTLDPLAGLGPYDLTATVTDGTGASDTATVQVLLNKPPVLSGQSPASTTITKNHASPNLTFSITGSDPNSDSLRYIWTVNGVNYEPPYSGLPSHISINSGSPNQLIFNPDESLLGNHTISVRAREDRTTDFEYSNTISWQLTLNRFSDPCNALQSGQICTLAGLPGLGKDVNGNGRFDAGTDKIKIRPNQLAFHTVQNLDSSNVDNMFISDTANHMIWYYNRSDKQQTVLGVAVEAYEVKPLFGNGASGKTQDDSSTYSYTNYKLSYPEFLIYDSTNQYLYVADRGNHRVVRLNNQGQGKRVFGTEGTTNNAGTNTTGAAATSHVCWSPAGLVMNAAKTKMWVACSTTNAIKEINLVTYLDPSTWTARVLVGAPNTAPTNATTDGTTAGTSAADRPWALQLDNNENLYFSQISGCRIRAINLATAGGLNLFNGTVTGLNPLAINNVRTAIGDGNCGYHGTLTPVDSGRIGVPRGFAILTESSALQGFFIAGTEVHRIIYANATGSTRTFGNMGVAANSINTIWGTGTGAFTGNTKPASNNLTYNPVGTYIRNGKLIITEPSAFRIRELDISNADGNITTLLFGLDPKHDSSPDSPGVDAPNFRGYFLGDIHYDSTTNSLLFADAGSTGMPATTHHTAQGNLIENNRIRSLNLTTGLVTTFIGQGSGTYLDQQNPTSVYLQGARAVTNFGDNLLILDRNWWQGPNRSCSVLMYNRSSPAGNFFSVYADAMKVTRLAGNWAQGCDNELGLGSAATSARIQPFSIAYASSPEDTIYMTQFRRHCILKVAANGNISSAAGLCGTSGDVDGALSVARFNFPTKIIQDPRNPSNMFVMDQTSSTNSYIKYINFSASEVDIGGVQVAAGEVKKILSVTDGYGIGIGLYKDSTDAAKDRICYTSGSGINSTLSNNSLDVGDGQLGFHRVTCHLLQTLQKEIVIGSDNSVVRGGSQMTDEHEGLAFEVGAIKKIKTLLYTPYGLAFDGDGNLYITERDSHVIRKVKKWW